MKLEHEGYILNIDEVGKDCYRTSCTELPYYFGGLHNNNLDTIIKVFKNEVQRTKLKESKLQEIDKEIKALLEKQAYWNSPNARLEIDDERILENRKNKEKEVVYVPWGLVLNNKTFVVNFIEETKQYYCHVTNHLTFTGKSITEVANQLTELAEAFNLSETDIKL